MNWANAEPTVRTVVPAMAKQADQLDLALVAWSHLQKSECELCSGRKALVGFGAISLLG